MKEDTDIFLFLQWGKLLSLKSFTAISLIFLILSCSDQQNTEETNQLAPERSSLLFNNYFFLNQEFDHVNFPIWFNTYYIKKKKIQSLKINSFFEDDTIPQIKRIFKFSKDGHIEKYEHSLYTNFQKLLEVHFNYKKAPDSIGFSEFIFKKVYRLNFSEAPEFMHIAYSLEDFNNEATEILNPNVVLRKNTNPKENPIIHILDTSIQNISYVDKLQRDWQEAYFIYGPPNQPKSSFFLENMVESSHYCTYNYFKNQFIKKHTTRYKNYFTESKINLDSLRRIESWQTNFFTIDTLFIGVENIDFNYDSFGMLKQLTFKKGSDKESLKVRKRMKLFYESYEEE